MTTYLEFEMDPNLLVSTIKSQAGSLAKAILEGVMNAVDAKASRVDVTLSNNSFRIQDNGRGFQSEDEIRRYFRRFGTPHMDGDAVFGRYRMGRGQLMAFAQAVWRSGPYSMSVDIEQRGMGFDFANDNPPQEGCLVEGNLYKGLSEVGLQEQIDEIAKLVRFMPISVVVNGQEMSTPPTTFKRWTQENEHAWFMLDERLTELHIYSLGAFVESRPAAQFGVGGAVVTKTALKVNFARNAVMLNECPVWPQISTTLRQHGIQRIRPSLSLADAQRKFLANNFKAVLECHGDKAFGFKIVPGPDGKEYTLGDMRRAKVLAYCAQGNSGAVSAHGRDGVFVVTDEALNRFGSYSVHSLLERLKDAGVVFDADVSAVETGFARMVLSKEQVPTSKLRAREKAALDTLHFINDKLAEALRDGENFRQRELYVVDSKKNAALAWTDGYRSIWLRRDHVLRIEAGLPGIEEWVHILVHEYCHCDDDSETHSHGREFYQEFHDKLLFNRKLCVSVLARDSLRFYLDALERKCIPKPHALTRQLKR